MPILRVMNLAFVWGAGAVLSGWIILRLIGGERLRAEDLSRMGNQPATRTTSCSGP